MDADEHRFFKCRVESAEGKGLKTKTWRQKDAEFLSPSFCHYQRSSAFIGGLNFICGEKSYAALRGCEIGRCSVNLRPRDIQAAHLPRRNSRDSISSCGTNSAQGRWHSS